MAHVTCDIALSHARKLRPLATRRRLAHCIEVAIAALLLVSASVALASCGGSSSVTTIPTLIVPTLTATPTVLYQADWSRGLAGWNASAGWTVVDGALQSDVGSERSVTIPYRPAGPDYSVEFELQVVSVPVTGGYYILHALPAPDANGYQSGVYALQAPGPRPPNVNPTSHAIIDPSDAQNPLTSRNSVHDFNHGTNWRTYRVDVRGSTVSLVIDGRPNTQGSSAQTAHLSTGPLQLMCSDVEIRVRALRILSGG
ncbi:MAG TPA: family 16 glycoside hydrolase [Ktedonobacterales bacterium]|nr:family 16 glycoside hydrolase [Ktedonobacterales bacterium]